MNKETMRVRCSPREPISEIEDDARKESGLGDAKCKAQEVEARHARNERHRGRHHAPADHDAGDPDARAEPMESKVARDLEKDVAGEEDARTKPKDLRCKAEIGIHREGGEADIDAVEEIPRVAQAKKREEAEARLADSAGGVILGHGPPRFPVRNAPALIEWRSPRSHTLLPRFVSRRSSNGHSA
jgi:hypothetical protein